MAFALALPGMLWMARLETTKSKLLSSKGRARMSPECSSMRSATPSAIELRLVASAELPDWSKLPQVHAHCSTCGETLSSHQKNCASTAPHIENALVTS